MLRKSVPTPKQLKAWDDTRAALMWYCPYFTHVLYTLMNRDENYVAYFTDDSEEVPVAAVDDAGICINTGIQGFFRFNLMERLFIVAHEILHAIFNHVILLWHLIKTQKVVLSNGKVLPLDEPLMQKALDYVINAILIDSKVGKAPDGVLYDLKIAKPTESVLDVYAKLYMSKHGSGGKPPGGGSSGGERPEDQDGSAEGGFDMHLAPGTLSEKKPEQAINEHSDAEWNTVISAGMELAKAQGKLPATMEMLFGQAIETKIDWTDHVHAFFARKVGSGASDWRHADRKLIVRDIWAPARSGHGCELVVIANDTSGSIWAVPKVMDLWFGIIGEIVEQLRPKRVVAIWCDENIGQVNEIEELSDVARLRDKAVPGGGGTSFVPVFDYVWEERLEPDALVYLTDGYGTFPPRDPGYPVLWGGLHGTLAASSYPFGEVVILPELDE